MVVVRVVIPWMAVIVVIVVAVAVIVVAVAVVMRTGGNCSMAIWERAI